MIRKFILPALALLGVLFGVYMVKAGNKPPAVAAPVADPARPPYKTYVAGAGLVEAATENIQIGTPVAGVVTEVYRRVNDPIKAGLPHEVVRRLTPLITAGGAEEQYDDTIAAAPAPSTQPSTQPTSRPADAIAAQEKVNINTAAGADLAKLPGIDAQQVKKIIAGRPYASVWDLEGTSLFKIDDRAARATLAIDKAMADQSRSKLAKLVRGNREEEIGVAKAQYEEAQANYFNAKRLYLRWASVEDNSAVPPDELANRESTMLESDARVRRTKANFEMLTAGTWEPDIAVARAELAAADAQVRSALTEIDRLTIRAPIDGTVLQVKVRPGEYAPSGVLQIPLMLVGRVDVLHIRTDVDEHEAMRVRKDAKAVASIRGDSTHQVQLHLVYIEPNVTPKKSLTGDSSERVDTRVLQIVYAFDPKELNAYVGQQMDVFIDAEQADAERMKAAQPAK